MNLLKTDQDELNYLLSLVKEQSINYLNNLDERSTFVSPIKIENEALADEGIGLSSTLKKFNRDYEALMVASSGPRYLGYVTGGSTPASIAGDWLTSVYDQNTQSVSGSGDLSAILEQQTIKLFRELLGLTPDFTGGFVTGATMSNFTCLAVARQWFGRKEGKDIAKEGVAGKIPILSSVTHSSILKSLSMIGIGSNNLEQVEILQGREAMSIVDLTSRIEKLGCSPFILITSAGTVNTGDYDDFKAINQLRKKHDFWWHIDGAFGAMAACSPNYKHLLEDWEFADSVTVDCHKWLNVPYENAAFFVKERHNELQFETFQNTNAPYLNKESTAFTYLNFLPENSRRFKALPVWFTLTAYGKNGYRSIVEKSINLAKQLSDYIEKSDNFELMSPTRLNNICFTLRRSDLKTDEFLSTVNNSGKVFMTPTVLNGRTGIRLSFVNWRTNKEDIEIIIAEIEAVYKAIQLAKESNFTESRKEFQQLSLGDR
jgi:glutamate/tyrosine decarboxylase-like PLP-dependent enzyme